MNRLCEPVYTEGAKLCRPILFLTLLLAGMPAAAQLASDEVPHKRTLPIREDVRLELENSRFRLGVFRLQPTFALRDLGYDNNVLGTTNNPISDWHSSVAAGTNFILPAGSKIYLRGEAVPEYTYYQKLTNRRGFGGNYGLSLLGLYNRMTVEAAAHSFKGPAIISTEVEQPAIGTLSDATGKIEIEILHRLSIFGQGEAQRQRYDMSAADGVLSGQLNTLERNETLARGGVRYQFTSFLNISTAFEATRTSFLVRSDRNNKSNAAILGVLYDAKRSFVSISAGVRQGRGQESTTANFLRYSTTTGSYYAEHELAVGITVDAYGHRGLVYSLTPSNPYYMETRNGIGTIIPAGRRFALRLFGEAGSNAYPVPVQSQKRTDDATAFGGGFAVRVYRNMTLTTLATSTRYNSTIADNNRSIFRITTVVSTQVGFFR